MLKALSKKIHPNLYVKIYKSRFEVREIGNRQKVLSIAPEKSIGVEGLIAGDFSMAERALRSVLKQFKISLILAYRPIVVIHPIEAKENGLSPIEVHAFLELALGAGAYKAVVWTGPELTNDEVIEKIKNA
jgi:hypothetical protein